MKTVKILVTAPNLITGGAEKQLIHLLKGLVNRDFELVLLLFEREGEYVDQVPHGVKILTPSSPKPPKPFKFFWKIKEIIKAANKEKPDILYSRLWPTKVATVIAGILLRKKVNSSEDRSLRHLTNENSDGKLRLDGHVKKIASHLADLTVPVSMGIALELKNIFKLNRNKIKLIYNGFDFDEIRKKAEEDINHPWINNGKDPVVGALGRMVKLKGFDHLLEAVKILKNENLSVRLLMIGNGDALQDLKNQAKKLGIENMVDFMGFVENPFAFLSRCNLFILSSLYEGLPSTLIEAMALGVPVISTRCPTGPEEIIEDEKNGLLIPVADPEAIAGAITRIVRDEDLSMRLRIEGKRRAEVFSLDNMISSFANTFVELSSSK